MNKCQLILSTCLFMLYVFAPQQSSAFNYRHISKKDRLTNSAILSMCQDSDGYMWFGSCDGLNMYNGATISAYQPSSDENSFSGNIIENIIETQNGILWVQTNYGLNRFDKKNRSIKRYDEYSANYQIRSSGLAEVFFIREKGQLVYLNNSTQLFEQITIDRLPPRESILDYYMDSANILWVASEQGMLTFHCHKTKNGEISISKPSVSKHDYSLRAISFRNNRAIYIDKSYELFDYDLITNNKEYVCSMRGEIAQRGKVSTMIRHKDNYFIGFQTDGLISLNKSNKQSGWKIEDMNLRSGIFCMVSDARQDIVWIGTDGDGVYALTDGPYTIRSHTFESFSGSNMKPVRALFNDTNNDLWIGTKGDGIIHIKSYSIHQPIQTSQVKYYTTQNSGLKNNSVYSFGTSNKDIIWIGSDTGLDYYSRKEGRIKSLEVNTPEGTLRYVHDVYEANDSTLWIATVGTGIVKATIGWRGDTPYCRTTKRYTIRDGGMSSNYFFCIYPQSESLIWFGNRGYGAYSLDLTNDWFEPLEFSNVSDNKTLNDIFSIEKGENGTIWFGTSAGLIKHYSQNVDKLFSEPEGFINKTIHGMLRDSEGHLWLSTNLGVAKFNPMTETVLTFNENNGLDIIEFSDGAYCKDEQRNLLFFGGINGFAAFQTGGLTAKEFNPPIIFDGLSILGNPENINKYMQTDNGGGQMLKLKHNQNIFSISFSAIDYIYGLNYSFHYRFEGLNESWIKNGNSGTLSFTNIPYGDYKLHIKYLNGDNSKESDIYTIHIRISPPWYLTLLTKTLYLLITLTLIAYALYSWDRRRAHKREVVVEKLTQEHQKEVYESKLKFFTSIVHEFCTPLTLIFGPCDRILSYPNSDKFVKKYTELIWNNAKRLNDLIQDLIEFRRIETGNKQPQITNHNISQLTDEIADNFAEMADSRKIKFVRRICQEIEWYTDRSFIITVITNLLSNSFKYVSKEGEISIDVSQKNSNLYIAVTNTGKGIKAEDMGRLFDRYSILDDFENQSKSLTIRNGLGLAITYDMVRLLGGSIDVKSKINETTTFTVTIPKAEPSALTPNTTADSQPDTSLTQIHSINKEVKAVIEIPQYAFDQRKQTIMVIDDDREMLWFISEIFSKDYNVIATDKPRKVTEFLGDIIPNLIISDVMMPEMDGITLTKQIKADPQIAHVPLILISAKYELNEQIEGIEAGAQMYITKPFSVDYLRTIVKQLISHKDELKKYFSSPLSAFDLSDGKLTHVEHHKFIQQILNIINDNIANEDLSAKLIADKLGIGTRQLYRRVEEIGSASPMEMIRDCRLHIAQDLLINSKFTVDEVIYKSGFSNRGPFFKAFAAKYGCTPKAYRDSHTELSDSDL